MPLRIVLSEKRKMRPKSMINARRNNYESVMDAVSHMTVHFSDEKNSLTHIHSGGHILVSSHKIPHTSL